MSVHLSVCLFVCRPIGHFVCLSVGPSVWLSVFLSVVCFSLVVCLPAGRSAGLSVQLFTLSKRLSPKRSLSLTFCLFFPNWSSSFDSLFCLSFSRFLIYLVQLNEIGVLFTLQDFRRNAERVKNPLDQNIRPGYASENDWQTFSPIQWPY